MTGVLLNALAPVFFVMALGVLAGRSGRVASDHIDSLNSLVMEFALPAAIFVAAASTSRAEILTQWPLIVILGVSMLGLYGLAYALQRWLFAAGPEAASIQALTIAQPNFGAAGLPLLAALYGAHASLYAALALAVMSVTVSPLPLIVLEAERSLRAGEGNVAAIVLKASGRSLLKPILLAPLAGAALALAGVSLPTFAEKSCALMGEVGAGAALFVTGLLIASQPIILNLDVISGALLKNLGQPLLAFALAMLLPIHGQARGAAVLLAAMPSGFFGALFALKYGVASKDSGSTLLVSTILSALTLAVAIVALPWLG